MGHCPYFLTRRDGQNYRSSLRNVRFEGSSEVRIVPQRVGGIAWISEKCLESIIAEARRCFPLETGGVLMGYWTPTKVEVVITRSIGPGPASTHTESTFEPDTAYQQDQINRIYAESNRIYTYLGDWHSHPRLAEGLSPRDKRTLRMIATDRRARAPSPIVGILTKRHTWNLILWQGSIQRLTCRLVVTRLHLHRFS